MDLSEPGESLSDVGLLRLIQVFEGLLEQVDGPVLRLFAEFADQAGELLPVGVVHRQAPLHCKGSPFQ